MVEESKWLEEVLRRQAKDIEEISQCIQKLPETLEKKYLTKTEYQADISPIKWLAYGIASVALSIVLVAIVRQVVK